MAHAPERSMNGNLAEGMLDGTVKSRNMNRGGFVEYTTETAREGANDEYLNIKDGRYMAQSPDGTHRNLNGTVHYMSPIRPVS